MNQEEERQRMVVDQFRRDLLRLNSLKHNAVMTDVLLGVENVVTGAKYQHVDPEGPRNTKVSAREVEVHPPEYGPSMWHLDDPQELVAPYFTCPDLPTLEEEFALAHDPRGAVCMAHNGWVIGDDPLKNFALPGRTKNIYLRRELVAWGDSVKLR